MSKIILSTATSPATPPAGKVVLYAKSDKRLYFKDENGVETALRSVGSGSGDLLADGTVPLTANWDVGSFKIIALQLESDVTTGTAPFIVASTTLVNNLNAEMVGGTNLAGIQTLIDTAVVGLYDHKGAYDASTNTPDLDTSPSGIKKGDAYTVSVAGTFYAVALEAGDVLIADIDNPVASTSWTIVNRNIDSSAFATAAQGATADAALPKVGGTMSGNIVMAGAETVDGRDVSVDGATLDTALLDADFSAAEGMMRKTAAGAYTAIKSNLAAAVAPVVTDDSGAGYGVGSVWIDTTGDKIYFCLDASAGAAVWQEVGAGGGGGLAASVKTGAYTILASEDVGVDSSGGVFDVTLKATPSTGDVAYIRDVAQSCGTNAVGILRNGQTINGVAADESLNVDSGVYMFIFDGTTWVFTPITVGGLNQTQVDARITLKTVGRKTRDFWMRRDMYLTTTQQPSAEGTIGTNANAHLVYRSFDADAVECVLFNWVVPDDFDETQGVAFKPIWSPATTNTGDCYFELRALAYADGDPIVAGHAATGCYSTDAGQGTVNDIQIGPESNYQTFVGTLLKGQPVNFRYQRSASSGPDTLTGDANIIGIQLIWKTDAAIEG